MKKLLLLISCLFTCFSFLLGQKSPKKINGKEIIGYYPGWQVYDRENIAQPNQLNYRKFTTIIYAFFKPDFSRYSLFRAKCCESCKISGSFKGKLCCSYQMHTRTVHILCIESSVCTYAVCMQVGISTYICADVRTDA